MREREDYFPAEWEEQEFVQLTWPHAETDWAYMLGEVQECFVRIAAAIAEREKVLIVTPEPEAVAGQIDGLVRMENVRVARVGSNDTWARDHGAITVIEDGRPSLLDFQFNGWGLKFAADKDNLITERLVAGGVIDARRCNCRGFVFEGGSIESDGRGTLLTTAECLLSPNRNAQMTRTEIETYLCCTLHARRVLWLEHGYLAGDDTDSHIDTLARLCPDDTIAYVRCGDRGDEHYEELRAMEREIEALRTDDGRPYMLLPLPMADAVYDGNGERLPATYANFLVINGAVLVPTYADRHDAEALAQIAVAFPDREIIGIDCRALIRQHGSLHCVTMQYPKGVGLNGHNGI